MTVATVYHWCIRWAMANDWAPVITFAAHPVWFLTWMAQIPMWPWLYIHRVHRLGHSPRISSNWRCHPTRRTPAQKKQMYAR